MDNREKDRVSQRTSPTEAGQGNKDVSEKLGREQNSGTSAEFGQKIGRTENLSEGGEMHTKDKNDMNRNVGMGDEQTRRPSSEEFGSSSGRKPGSMGDDKQKISEDRGPSRSGSDSGTGSSEGRH